MADIVLQLFANREVRYGIQSFIRPRKSAGDKSADRRWEHESREFALSQATVVSGHTCDYQVSRDPNYCRVLSRDEGETARNRISHALDITREFQQVRKANRNKRRSYEIDNPPRVFTRSARHRLLEAGAVAQGWTGDTTTGFFVTLTLPGNTTSAMRALARWSGYVCNRLTQVIRRTSVESVWFYAWEWQKRGALHLHLYLAQDTTERGVQTCIDLVCQWYRALDSVSEKSGVDLYSRGKGRGRAPMRVWQFDIRQVAYGSASAYISKYVGKGGRYEKGVKGFGESDRRFYPARWWGISRNLKRMTDEQRRSVKIVGVTSKEALEILESLSRCLLRERCIGSYSYGFEIYAGRGDSRFLLGSGTRWIEYYSDYEFAAIGVWFAPWVRFTLARYPSARLEWEYGNPLHPCKAIA